MIVPSRACAFTGEVAAGFYARHVAFQSARQWYDAAEIGSMPRNIAPTDCISRRGYIAVFGSTTIGSDKHRASGTCRLVIVVAVYFGAPAADAVP